MISDFWYPHPDPHVQPMLITSVGRTVSLKILLCRSHFIIKQEFNLQNNIWAASWQNQQNDCAPSKVSDQPRHPPSLISLRCPHEEMLAP